MNRYNKMKKKGTSKKSLIQEIHSDDQDNAPLVNAFNNIIKKFSKKSGKQKTVSRVVDDETEDNEEDMSVNMMEYIEKQSQSDVEEILQDSYEQIYEEQPPVSKKTAKKSSKNNGVKPTRKIVSVKNSSLMLDLEERKSARQASLMIPEKKVEEKQIKGKSKIPSILIPIEPEVCIKQDQQIGNIIKKIIEEEERYKDKSIQNNSQESLNEVQIQISLDVVEAPRQEDPLKKRQSKKISQKTSKKKKKIPIQKKMQIQREQPEIQKDKSLSIQQINDDEFRQIQKLANKNDDCEQIIQEQSREPNKPRKKETVSDPQSMQKSRVVSFDNKPLSSQYSKQNRCNLTQLSLQDLVNELFHRKVISLCLYSSFIDNHSEEDVFTFLSRFKEGKLHHFDFKTHPISILDHRRLSELLYNLHTDIYYKGPCRHSNPELYDFLINLYELPANHYFQLYNKVDSISHIEWWKELMKIHDEKLMEKDRERRLATRKVQNAMRAVSNVVHGPIPQIREVDEVEDEKRSRNLPGFHKFHSKKSGKKPGAQVGELSQIRSMVSQFGTSKTGNLDTSNADQSMRQKIKFY